MQKNKLERFFMALKPRNQINMTEGSLIAKIISFSIPLIVTNMLQLVYNAADMIVVGQFAGPQALSAVGSSGPLVNLIIGCFMGLSMGAGVTISRAYGGGDAENMDKTLHTALTAAALSSVVVMIIGLLAARPLLTLMQSPPDVIDGATLYIRIFFLGMPFNLVYNFGAAMLRAVGDTKRPLKYLAFSGIVNVILNLFFVIVLGMSVAGVALATIAAQAISAVLIVRCFLKYNDILKLDLKKLKLHKEQLKEIVRIGLPAGVQGSLFSLSNATVQSAINSFGSSVVAGNVAASNLEGFLYVAMNSITQATLTAAGQNMGARKFLRARKGLLYGLGIVAVIGGTLGLLMNLLGPQLLSLYNTEPSVIAIGVMKLRITTSVYFIFGMMDVMVGQLRGMGSSLMPTVVSLCGVCIFRIFWVMVVFPMFGTLESIYYVYPLSWIITACAQGVMYLIISSRLPKFDVAVIR